MGNRNAAGPHAGKLDRRLVDYKPDRSLSDRSKITPITTALPDTSYTPYGRVPFLKEMHRQMGIEDPMNAPLDAYMDARKALFKKQPVQDLPLDKMVVTQKFVNTDKIAEGRARGNAAFGDMPIDAVKFQGKHYVMNGHHRAVTAAMNGDKTMRARVLDLDKAPVAKGAPLGNDNAAKNHVSSNRQIGEGFVSKVTEPNPWDKTGVSRTDDAVPVTFPPRAPKAGEKMVVFRVGGETPDGLSGHNGADSVGLSNFIEDAKDFEKSTGSRNPLHSIHAYEVTFHKDVGNDYVAIEGANSGKQPVESYVGMRNTFGGRDFSFPTGATAHNERHLASVPLSDLKDAVKGVSDTGIYVLAANIEKTFAPKLKSLVSKANPYRNKGRYTSKDKATSVTTMEQDMTQQASWLNARAQELGHADMDVLAHKDMTKFFELTKKWRRHHAFKLESLLNMFVK